MGACEPEQGWEKQIEKNGEKETRKKKKPILLYILISFCVLTLAFLINIKDMRKEKQEHPPEEIALYLEQCFGLPCKVSYNEVSAFSDSRYAGQIPYVGETVLEDGTTLVFSVGLDRAFPYLDGGLYTDFEEEMLSHYASVYGIRCDTIPYYFTLQPTKEQIEGEEAALKKFLDTVMDCSYIQNGQEIELEITLENGWGESVTLKSDSPLDYEALSAKLLDLLARWGEEM